MSAEGARLSMPRIAFRAWVMSRAPAAMARRPVSASASVWPTAATAPASAIRAMASRAPGSSGASVTMAGEKAARSRSSSSGAGGRSAAAGWAPGRARKGPSRWTPRGRAPAAGHSAAASAAAARR